MLTIFSNQKKEKDSMKKILWCLPLVLFSCSNLEDAKPEQRNSFAYFYGSDQNMISVATVLDGDGIIMIGFKSVSLTDLTKPTLVIMKADLKGKSLWQKEYSQLYARAIKPIADGYLVAADSIKIETDPVTSTSTTKLRTNLFKMDLQGNIVYQFSSSLSTFNFISNSVNTDTQGNVYLVGTIVRGINNKSSYAARFKPSGTGYTLDWFQDFDLQTRNYDNGRSVHITSIGNIIWPTSVEATLQGRSYAAFPLVKPQSTFENNGLFGETDDVNNFIVSDLQPSATGFAAIGTQYTIATGNNPTGTNHFFVMLDKQGNVQKSSAKYFDGGVNVTQNPSASEVEDRGIALTSCADGGYLLAGLINSTPTRGNGGIDVLIIKLDGFGNLQWTQSYGGSGNEVVNSVIQTADGGYLLGGTSTVQNFASMFVMKLNSNGELKD
jgi:hypothetical protein